MGCFDDDGDFCDVGLELERGPDLAVHLDGIHFSRTDPEDDAPELIDDGYLDTDDDWDELIACWDNVKLGLSLERELALVFLCQRGKAVSVALEAAHKAGDRALVAVLSPRYRALERRCIDAWLAHHDGDAELAKWLR